MPVQGRGIVQLSGKLSHFDELILPHAANLCATRDDTIAAWSGPNKWLLIGARTDAHRWVATATAGGSLVDLSHGRTIVRIAGAWREIMAQGCPVDLPGALPAHQWGCVQSLFCDIPVLMLTPGSHRWVELYAPRSYGDYLWELLKTHAGENRYRVGSVLSGAAGLCGDEAAEM
jgi:heterotetrameric sarcosine oxidase gamma subunit